MLKRSISLLLAVLMLLPLFGCADGTPDAPVDSAEESQSDTVMPEPPAAAPETADDAGTNMLKDASLVEAVNIVDHGNNNYKGLVDGGIAPGPTHMQMSLNGRILDVDKRYDADGIESANGEYIWMISYELLNKATLNSVSLYSIDLVPSGINNTVPWLLHDFDILVSETGAVGSWKLAYRAEDLHDREFDTDRYEFVEAHDDRLDYWLFSDRFDQPVDAMFVKLAVPTLTNETLSTKNWINVTELELYGRLADGVTAAPVTTAAAPITTTAAPVTTTAAPVTTIAVPPAVSSEEPGENAVEYTYNGATVLKNPWIPEREATVCTWKFDYNRGMVSNMNVSLINDFACLSNRQLKEYAKMMKECGFTGIQVTDMCSAWRAVGTWETMHDKYKVLADACHELGMKFTVWCWAAEFSGHGWQDPDVVYTNADPTKPAYKDQRVLDTFNKYYDIYADLAPYVDRVIAHFYDPGNLRDTESILYFVRLLKDKFREKNPNVEVGIDTWGSPSDFPNQLVAAGMTDIMLMELPFLPSWRQEGKRAEFRAGVKKLGCTLGSWGWYTCEYEIDQMAAMFVNNRVIKDVYTQTRIQGDSVMTPAYWSEMDSNHILNFFSMYAAGHLLIDPDADPDVLLSDSVWAIVGRSHPENAARLLAALELIRDARSGNTWNSYWWTEPGYIMTHGDYSGILERAPKVIRDFEKLLKEEEPTDGISFPITRRQLYSLILPSLYQIQEFAKFRIAFDDILNNRRGKKRAELQALIDKLSFDIPEYNGVTGMWGGYEARAAYVLVEQFCTDYFLTVPERSASVKFAFKRRVVDKMAVAQRGQTQPVYVGPTYYEGSYIGAAFAAKLMEELYAEGVLIKNSAGNYALSNWSDYRFDISH